MVTVLYSVEAKMLLKAGFFLLAVIAIQVSAEITEPKFIEDVIKSESEALNSGSRIVSGWEALPGQHPHQANLRMVDAAGGVSSCGGSVVHREWLITAAHCTALRITLVVRAGVVSLTTPEYIFETTQWWNYPTYIDSLVSVVQPNDIAIVKLERPVTYSNNLKAIRIQSSSDAFRDYSGLTVHASGHGRTWTLGPQPEILNWVYLRTIANSACAQTFGTNLINSNAICAQWYNVTSQSTCQGDSGGPLVHVDANGVDTLIGVTSFVAGGDFGCHSGLPAGFIRPGPFHSWLTQVSGVDFENLQEDDDDEETPTTPPPEDDDEDSSSEGSDEDDDDDDLSEIIKRLQIKVKVKVNINKYKVKKVVEKERTHQLA